MYYIRFYIYIYIYIRFYIYYILFADFKAVANNFPLI